MYKKDLQTSGAMLHVLLTSKAHPNRYGHCGNVDSAITAVYSKNHIVERIWVEINARVNYPVKSCLIALEEAGNINMDCPHVKYCVSWFTIRVCCIGTTMVVSAWNHRPKPGNYNVLPIV